MSSSTSVTVVIIVRYRVSIDKTQILNHKSKLAAVKLSISKSIANRLLLLQAIHGDSLLRVSPDMPDDVIVLHDALQQLREYKKSPITNHQSPIVLNLKNCGTALRFLQVHLEQCYPGEPITLTGDARLMERKGKPTSQTNSALLMHGIEVSDESPYVEMTRRVIEMYNHQSSITNYQSPIESGLLEADWSAAAFWYEYIAIHGGELLLEGLTADSIQGDRIVADIYAKYFGVTTTFTAEGALIKHKSSISNHKFARLSRSEEIINHKSVSLNFERIPDLYPAIALTCEILKMDLQATGTERLKYKESNRLEAVRLHEVRNDHRIAMALIAADCTDLQSLTLEKKDELQSIIAKSYPHFIEQFTEQLANFHLINTCKTRQRHGNDTTTTRKRHVNETKTRRKRQQGETYLTCENIIPQKGVNDDNLGKKHALSKLIHAATSEYIWLHDDDVELPKAAKEPNLIFLEGKENCDLLILPLRMESALPLGRDGVGSSLLERLQIAEYAAIQELTMRTAKRGHAVMCSGANLIVRREAWLACEVDLHPEIPSGDDMFLLEATKRKGYKIGVIDEPDFTAIVRPQTTWRAFFRQRMRWAGKAPHYTDKDIRRCGAWVLAANILQLLCPLIILIKFPIEYSLIRKRQISEKQILNFKSQITNTLTILLLELVYPFYLLISLVGGLFRKKEW